ncbi:hypothetical protein, partial [Mycobacterium tuberculosis]
RGPARCRRHRRAAARRERTQRLAIAGRPATTRGVEGISCSPQMMP